MPMQARRVQIVITGDLRRWLASGEAAVDLGALEVLTCLTIGLRLRMLPQVCAVQRWAFELTGVDFIDKNGGGLGVRFRKRHLAKQPPIRANTVGTKVPAPCLHKVPDGGSYERFLEQELVRSCAGTWLCGRGAGKCTNQRRPREEVPVAYDQGASH